MKHLDQRRETDAIEATTIETREILDVDASTEPIAQTRDGRPFPAAIERAVHQLHWPLGLLWDRGFRFLFVLDAVGLYFTLVPINIARFGWTWPDYPRTHYWVGFAGATAIHLTANYFAGLCEREPRRPTRDLRPTRAGLWGTEFQVLKFRTIVHDAERSVSHRPAPQTRVQPAIHRQLVARSRRADSASHGDRGTAETSVILNAKLAVGRRR